MTASPKRERAGAGNADPIEAETLGKVEAQYSETESAATVMRFPRDRKNLRSTAAIRLAELVRLAVGRRQHGLRVDPALFAWTLAATLGSASPGTYPIPKRQRAIRWHGLNLESLRHAIERAQLGEFSNAELGSIIADIERGHAARGPGLIRATKLGHMLDVTAAEREAFKLRTIEACDEPREARQARQAETRKARDAERKRAERGRTPWPVYQAKSLSAQKPWEAEGISRRTWERRRQRVANVSTQVLSIGSSDTIATGGSSSLGTRQEHSARTGGDVRPVCAGGPSPGATPIEAEARQNGRARVSGDAEDQEPGSEPLIERSEKLAVMSLEESPMNAAALIDAIREAEAILAAQRGRMRGAARDRLDEVLTLLPGIVMIAEWDAEIPEHVQACAEGVVVKLRPYANDNRIAGIVRRLAA